MRRMRQDHMVNILLPLALLLMFAVSAVAVVLFAARVYRSTVENSALNQESQTALAYVCEKVHSADSAGTIRVGTLEGSDALILEEIRSGERYNTYIYMYNGELKELFVKAGASVPGSSGRTVAVLESFSVTAARDDLLSFTCTDRAGRTAEAVVTVRSEGGAAHE